LREKLWRFETDRAPPSRQLERSGFLLIAGRVDAEQLAGFVEKKHCVSRLVELEYLDGGRIE
jgi:hypothetical protein